MNRPSVVTRNYLNPYDSLKASLKDKPLYDEGLWDIAQKSGQLDLYTSALANSDNLSKEQIFNDYNLWYGAADTMLPAIITEANKENTNTEKKTRQIPKVDEQGKLVTQLSKDGQTMEPVYDSVDMTDYEYNKYLIAQSNKEYGEQISAEIRERMRNERSDFSKFLGDIGVFVGSVGKGAYRAVEGMGAFVGASVEQLVDEAFLGDPDDETYAQRITQWYNGKADDRTLGYLWEQDINEFAYDYSHAYDKAGEITFAGETIMGVGDTIGKMLPTIALTIATAGAGSALSAGALAADVSAKAAIGMYLTSQAGALSQLAFYAGSVFVPTVTEQYEKYAAMGISISSAEIVSNALLKTVLQYSVENALGQVLGASGIDNFLWGKTAKAFTGTKSLTANYFLRMGLDAIHEGLEESLQDTTDWLVDQMHHFINNDFQATEWNWEDIGTTFVISAITSVLGDAVRTLGTKRVATGQYATNKTGELIKNKKTGQYEFKKLSKIQSYEFGVDMQSYSEMLNSVVEARTTYRAKYQEIRNNKNMTESQKQKEYKALDKALGQVRAAEMIAAKTYQVLAAVHTEIGDERFNKANQILENMTSSTRYRYDSPMGESQYKMDESQILEVLKLIDLKDTYYVTVEKAKQALKDAGLTNFIKQVNQGDDTDLDDELNKVAHKIMDKDKSIKSVLFAQSGDKVLRVGDVIIMPKNFAQADPNAKTVFYSVAEQRLADEVLRIGRATHGPVDIIHDLYKEWTGRDDVTVEEAIASLIFDQNFFFTMLCLNEKETGKFLLNIRGVLDQFRGDKNISDETFAKRIVEMQARWTNAAVEYYSNNKNANADEYARFLKGKEKADFLKAVEKRRFLFNSSEKFVKSPDKVTKEEWDFMFRRIANANISQEQKESITKRLQSDNVVERSEAMTELNLIYEGMFQSLYNGKVYLPNTSVGNRLFNTFLQQRNLTIYNMFDESKLTDAERAAIGEVTPESIYEFRMTQFSLMSKDGKYSFEVHDDGSITIKDGTKAVGWSAVPVAVSNTVATDESKLGVSIPTDIRSTSQFVRQLLNQDVIDQGIALWVSIDDIINDPTYLKEEVRDTIVEEYGDLSSDSVYKYLQSNLAEKSGGKQGIVTMQDGSAAVAIMTEITHLFAKDTTLADKKGKYKLSALMNPKHLTETAKNTTVVFGAKQNQYIDWELQDVNGQLTWVFVNRIEIAAGSESDVRFRLAHEIEHMFQTEKAMSSGSASAPLLLFDKKTQQEIIKEVKKVAPEMFKDKPSAQDVFKRVNRFLYYGAGELSAMGLSNTTEFHYYPVYVSRSADGRVTYTLQNGTQFSTYGAISTVRGKQLVGAAINDGIGKNYATLPNYQVADNQQARVEAAKNLCDQAVANPEMQTIETMRSILYNAYGYDMTQEEFDNSNLFAVNVNGAWYLCTDITHCQDVLGYSGDFLANTRVEFGLIKAKDLKTVEVGQLDAGQSIFRITFDGRKMTQRSNTKVEFNSPRGSIAQKFDISPKNDITSVDSATEVIGTAQDIIYEANFKYDKTHWDMGAAYRANNTNSTLADIVNASPAPLKSLFSQYLNRRYGTRMDPEIISKIQTTLEKDVKLGYESLVSLKKALGISDAMPMSEFLDLEIPIARLELRFDESTEGTTLAKLSNKDLVSAQLMLNEDSLRTMMQASAAKEYRPTNRLAGAVATPNETLYYQNVKIRDIAYAVNDQQGTVFIRSDKLADSKFAKFNNERTVNGSGTVNYFTNLSNYGTLQDGEQSAASGIESVAMDNFIADVDRVIEAGTKIRYASELHKRVMLTATENARRIYNLILDGTIRMSDDLIPVVYKQGITAQDMKGMETSNRTIVLSNTASYRTFLHELIHFDTAALLNINKTEANKLDSTLRYARDNLIHLYEIVKERTNKSVGLPPEISYYITNEHEFAAGLSDARFVEALSSLKEVQRDEALNKLSLFITGASGKTIISLMTKNAETVMKNTQMLDEKSATDVDQATKDQAAEEAKLAEQRKNDPRNKKNYLVDKREVQTKEFNPAIHEKKFTPVPDNVTDKVRDVDKNLNQPERVPGKRSAGYFYRRFLYRAYYTKADGSTGYRDIYEMWYEKDPTKRNWATKEERETTNLKYFKQDKEQLKINAGLKNIIIFSTDHKMPAELMEKIDGKDAGTLTENDVERYVFDNSPDAVTNKFFNVFNDAFYRNDNIHNASELDKITSLIPKMRALYLVLQKTDFKDVCFDKMTIEEFEELWMKFYNSDEKIQRKLQALEEAMTLRTNEDSYRPSAKDVPTLDIDGVYMKHKVMTRYEGTLASAAAIGKDVRTEAYNYELGRDSKNKFRQSATKESLDDLVGKDKSGDQTGETRANRIVDEEATGAYELEYNNMYDKNRESLLKRITDLQTQEGLNIAKLIAKKGEQLGLTSDEKRNAYVEFIRNISDSEFTTDEHLKDIYIAAINAFNSDIIGSERLSNILEDIFYMAGISEGMVDEEAHARWVAREKKYKQVARDQYKQKQNITNKVATINKYMSKEKMSRFMKENGKLFEQVDEKTVRLKDSVLYETVNGKQVLRPQNELNDINAKIKEISHDMRYNAYNSDEALAARKKIRKLETKLKAQQTTTAKVIAGSTDKVYKLDLGDGNTLDVDARATVPAPLKRIIELGTAREAVTQVQKFSKSQEVTGKNGEITTEYTEKHAVLVYDNFVKNSAAILAEIGQEGANEIVDFYLGDHGWIIGGAEDRVALSLQQLLLGYLYSLHYSNDLHFDPERLAKIEQFMSVQSSIGGTWLRNQRTILNNLKKIDSKKMAMGQALHLYGIDLDAEDQQNLEMFHNAMRNTKDSPDVARKKLETARRQFEQTLLRKYKGSKKSALSKILTFERAMMLSSPTTWLRNYASNIIVTGGNKLAGEVGDKAVNGLRKLFPKSKKFQDRTTDDMVQYKITGTKVSNETVNLINDLFIKSGLMADVLPSMSKYTERDFERQSGSNSIVDMLATKIAKEVKKEVIFGGKGKASKFGNEAISWIFDRISDDKFIQKKIIKYLGAIIEEEKAFNKNRKASDRLNLDIDKSSVYGVSTDMMTLFARAYQMAATDYMHSTNWVMDMEKYLQKRLGEKGYFIYKQIFPFVGQAWNWSVEGMRYTPLGLAMSIVKFATLEKSISKYQSDYQAGKPNAAPEFAQYIATRNIGKGIIGTIGLTAGMILYALGAAGIDKDDDKYKLFVGDVKVDISDLLGSQGILLGIALSTALDKQGVSPLGVISATLNQFFDDSVFQTVIDTFRYNNGVGDFIQDLLFEDMVSMMIPNFIRLLAKVSHHQGVIYDDGLLGWLEKFAAKNIPGSMYIFGQNFKVDPYTGEKQSFWSIDLGQYVFNRVMPIDVSFTTASGMELEAESLGVRHDNLNGRYTIDNQKVELSASEKVALNEFYGKLNKTSLQELYNGSATVKMPDGSFKELKYSQMSDEQKAAAIDNVMSNNSGYAKIYILTSTGRCKYYAGDTEYKALKKLGITKNVYKKTKVLNGFVAT